MLYYKKGSALFKEIKQLYKLYVSGDSHTLTHYEHLFNDTANSPDPPATSEASTPSSPEPEPASDGGHSVVTNPSADVSSGTQGPGSVDGNSKEDDGSGEDDDSSDTPTVTPKAPPFIHFQQTIIREKFKVISSEELAAVEQYIEETHAAALKAWERPWLTTPKSSKLPKELKTRSPHKSEEELEAEYYQK